MPTKMCATPGCANTVKRGHCDTHRKAIERERSRDRRADSHKSWYDRAKWRNTARRVKFETPICEACDSAISAEVHHDPPLAWLLEQGLNPFDRKYLTALCASCHSAETRREQQRPV
jgi:hypothetical protein